MNMIKDYITQDFDLLAGTLTPTEAIAQLKKNYGIVVDENNKPIALVVAEDLERSANNGASSLLHPQSRLRPTILVGCEVKMQDLADSPRMTLALDDEGQAVGVLPVEALNKYVDSTPVEQTIDELSLSASGGDSGLPGALQIPDGTVVCAACGHLNKVTYLDPEYLPTCKNPNPPSHTLKLSE
jgi:hypothetical protein